MPPLPDLAGLPRHRRRTRIAWGLAAAAVAAAVWTGGFVVGGATGDRAEVAVPTPSVTPTGTTVSAVLRPVEGSAGGTVSMTEDGTAAVMRIEADDLPALRAGQFYYAWLLDPATNKMLPLGQVGPGGTASFEVTPAPARGLLGRRRQPRDRRRGPGPLARARSCALSTHETHPHERNTHEEGTHRHRGRSSPWPPPPWPPPPRRSRATEKAGTTSLAEVLAADGTKFDKNWKDFDILEAAVVAVLGNDKNRPSACWPTGRRG